MRVSYIGNTPAFQAEKVGSIPTTRSMNKRCFIKLKHRLFYSQVNNGENRIQYLDYKYLVEDLI